MFIDTFSTHWQHLLDERHERLDNNTQLYLLLDGVFVPDLYRAVQPALGGKWVSLLFERLPSCSDATRAVSPFLLPYRPASAQLAHALSRCSGWPMVSAIETSESIEEVTARLAAWCVVENDGQRFNFRYPDTRRLPGLWAALTPLQRRTLAGPASSWCYMDRDGTWQALPLPRDSHPIADRPQLDHQQFAIMVADSEADEIMTLLRSRGRLPEMKPSQQYALVHDALRLAKIDQLGIELYPEWCDFFLHKGLRMDDSAGAVMLGAWRAAEMAALNAFDA